MPLDTSTYRARIGDYCPMAVSKSYQLSFITKANITSFLLIYLYGPAGVPAALLSFVMGRVKPNTVTGNASKPDTPRKAACETKVTPPHSVTSIVKTLLYLALSNIIVMLLQLAGDIHPNPGTILAGTNTPKEMSIIHINSRSLRNKMDFLETEVKSHDIITISETWLSEEIENNAIRLNGYQPPVRNDRPNDPHGGVAVYVKDNYICKPRPDLTIPNLEAVWIETRLAQEPLLIGTFYRPPNSTVDYWTLIDQSISNVCNLPCKFIVLGDFNSDFLNNPSPHLLDVILKNNLQQLVKTPTRYTETSATCIDLVLTPCHDIIRSTVVLPPICSDHSVPCVKVTNNCATNHSFKRSIYDYSKLDKEALLDELTNIDWISIASIPSIDEAAYTFSDQLMNVAKKCMPVKKIRVQRHDEPWITEEIKEKIELKNKIHKLAKTVNNDQSWKLFRQARNDLTSTIRKRKLEYIKELDIRVSSKDNFGTKHWWKLVKTFLSKKGCSSDSIPSIQHNDRVYYTNQEKADLFNDYFVKQSTVEDSELVPDVPFENTCIEQIVLSVDEVKAALKKLNPTKAAGPDLVHNKILTASSVAVADALTLLFNRSLSEGSFPSAWKTAHVNPIHKKGDRASCTNYRPISLLSCIGKVLEKCVHEHVFNYLQSNALLTPFQSGFIPKDSPVCQLLSVYNDLCKSLDKGVTGQAIFFDISKAFDKVWHRGLLHKLYAIGIRGQVLEWFRNYLSDRQQAVVILGSKSDYLTVTAGVPQGSVLGPLLFLIYINDIVVDIESIIKLFADDTSMYLCLENHQLRAEILNSDLVKIMTWANNWKVNFNQSKTELMNITNKRNQPFLPLYFGTDVLQNTEAHKHLGVILQSNCKWDSHIKSIISKCRTLIACLRSYKYRLSRKALEIMYRSFILPHFDYADIVWDNCSNSLAEELETLHLDGIRTVIGAVRGTSHRKLYLESGFTTLKERRRRHKLIMFHKIVNEVAPSYLNTEIPALVSTLNPYHRRQPLQRQVPTHRLEIYKSSFFSINYCTVE